MSETHEGEAYESEMCEGAAQEVLRTEDAHDSQLIELIRDHPWASVLGAAALGFVVARLVRRDR